MKHCTDNELLIQLRKGSRDAFTEIYNRYWGEMYFHAFRMLKSEDLSKDVLQDVFSNLWLRSADLNQDSKLSGLLYIAVRNNIFNLLSRNKLKEKHLHSLKLFVEQNNTYTESLLSEKEILQKIETEIAQLPAKMRLIFELSRKENLSHKEIAAKLNISEQTVKKQIHNALQILRPKLSIIVYGFLMLKYFS